MYDELDKRILAHILDYQATGKSAIPLYYYDISQEAKRIAYLTNRYSYRIIDSRLQALRKRGVIAFDRSTVSKWVVL